MDANGLEIYKKQTSRLGLMNIDQGRELLSHIRVGAAPYTEDVSRGRYKRKEPVR